jgi:hypothetical protein
MFSAILSADNLLTSLNAQSALMGGIGLTGSIVSLAADFETCSADAEVEETCPLCFAAGTPVHTSCGDVAIENIHEGDEVVSRNSNTGKLENEPVTALIPQHKDSLLEIRVEGERTPLRPSTHHPFWVKRGDADAAWIDSGQMRVGDFVQSLQGAWRRVVAITPLEVQETVYNFTVDKDHDYFVGQTGFLVHNAGGCGCEPGEFSIPDWSDYPPDLTYLLLYLSTFQMPFNDQQKTNCHFP